jgi:hypothetical protein
MFIVNYTPRLYVPKLEIPVAFYVSLIGLYLENFGARRTNMAPFDQFINGILFAFSLDKNIAVGKIFHIAC